MSYQDPYNPPQHQPQQPYSTYPAPGAYQEPGEYNPYEQQPQYPTYDQQPYSDNPQHGYDAGGYGNSPPQKEYDAARRSMGVPPKSTGLLRIWRHDMKGKQWTKGGGLRSCGRFFCCSLMTFLFVLLSVVLSLALFIRPPDITFNGIDTPTNGSAVQVLGTDSFVINLSLDVAVRNPNFFSADFSQISAQVFYPGHTAEPIGSGAVQNIVFKSNTNTDFLFPFAINYNTSIDPGLTILTDIGQKCGLGGSTRSNINVNYTLKLALKILFFTVSPSFSGSTGFACPLTQAQIQSILGPLLGGSG